jgi:predicted RNA binding protein YcfA (HicA-like mRNA interferase family)
MGKNKRQKITGPPNNQPWCWLSEAMIFSPAFRGLSVNGLRVFFCLMLEHMQHAGRENGNLKVPYDHLEEKGCSRSAIPEAIQELECFGWIKVRRGGKHHGTNHPSRYTLTCYHTLTAMNLAIHATNDWMKTTEEQIKIYKRKRKAKRKAKREMKKAGTKSSTIVPLNYYQNAK